MGIGQIEMLDDAYRRKAGFESGLMMRAIHAATISSIGGYMGAKHPERSVEIAELFFAKLGHGTSS
jgi:hypothetical protein